VVNDFVIPSKSASTAEQHRGRHFMIWFNPEDSHYYIKDLGIGYGVFFKIQEPIVRESFERVGLEGQYAVERWGSIHRSISYKRHL